MVIMGLFSNKDIWESLRRHTTRIDSLKKDILSLSLDLISLKARDTELDTKIDNINIPNVQPTINSLKEKFNKRCSEIENALLINNSQILELKNIKPIDVKTIINPLVQEINDKIEGLSNRINAQDDNRLELIKRIEELEKPKEAELPKLTDKQQTIFDLKKEGKTIKEIAEASKVSFQSIYQTIRAIKSKGYDI